MLAEAGLIDQKEATVSWFAAEQFQRQYPHIQLRKESVLIDQGNIIMAGASTAFLNLGIYLIEKYYGKRLANYTAKILMVNKGQTSQQSYSIFIGQKKHQDADIKAIQQYIEQHVQQDFTVEDLIEWSSLSPRTFVRRFKRATGMPPLEYMQRVKVEFAKQQLEVSDDSISQISYATGYRDLNFFRQLFKRYTGLTPLTYQRQFQFDNLKLASSHLAVK